MNIELVDRLMSENGFSAFGADEVSENTLALALLLWHFRGGELYLLVYDSDEGEPIRKVPLLQGLPTLTSEGEWYGLRFEAGDGFNEALKATQVVIDRQQEGL